MDVTEILKYCDDEIEKHGDTAIVMFGVKRKPSRNSVGDEGIRLWPRGPFGRVMQTGGVVRGHAQCAGGEEGGGRMTFDVLIYHLKVMGEAGIGVVTLLFFLSYISFRRVKAMEEETMKLKYNTARRRPK